MRHRVSKNLKFNGKSFQHRNAMQRNLVTSLFTHKAIKTTEKKAQSIIPMIDKLINFVNTKDKLNASKIVNSYLYTEQSYIELFDRIAPKYKNKKTSGFTRMTPVKLRDGDNAKLVLLELI